MLHHARVFANLVLTPALLLAAATAAGALEAPSPSAGAWEFLRPQFYGERPIGLVDETFMSLEAPANTPDPAATPVTIHFGPAAIGRIKQVRLIIDNNPSPVVSTFDLAEGARIEQLGLRVRVDRFTSMRVIAETRDGALEMRSQWVNASGGCSAPPSPAGGGALGEIRFRASPDGKALQVSIRHPNNSGFQIDPASGDPIAPHYVASLHISAGGAPLLAAETGISISENPTLRIVSDRALAAPVTVEAVDSKAMRFSAEWRGSAAATASNQSDSGAAHRP